MTTTEAQTKATKADVVNGRLDIIEQDLVLVRGRAERADKAITMMAEAIEALATPATSGDAGTTPGAALAAHAKATKAKPKSAKSAGKAQREYRAATYGMATARFGCECGFGCYNEDKATAHTAKDGHDAVALAA